MSRKNRKQRTQMIIKNSLINQNELTSDNPTERYKHAITFGKNTESLAAMDTALDSIDFFNSIQSMGGAVDGFTQAFLGYATLSNLMQNPLIRAGVETLTDEMINGWIDITRTGADDDITSSDDDIIAEINKEIEKYHIKEVLHKMAELCGYFGGGLLFVDNGEHNEDLKNPLKLDSSTFGVGKLKRLVPIEPINISPGSYNSSNPLDSNFFKPTTWYILGKEVHASRLIYFSINEPPMILKPSYNFFGISTAQLALDYCLHFTQDRESASRLLNKYSLTIFKTNMADILSGANNKDNLTRRIQLLADNRDNDCIEAIDKEDEDIVQINTPISGVTDIVRQALELLAVVFRMPAVKLLGISPAGFNATGQSDMDNWHEHVLSQSNKIFKKPITTLLKILQLNKYGKIDDSIIFNFKPIGKEDKQIAATTNKTIADTDKIYVDMGAISPQEVRNKLATDNNSGYSINPDEMPGDENNINPLPDNATDEENDYDDGFQPLDYPAEDEKNFNEDDVKRDDGGKFSKSGGSGSSENKQQNKPAQPPAPKEWGNAYTDYSGKPKEAIEHLLKNKSGYVPNAIHREEIGDIDFVWGEPDTKEKTGYGFAHILSRGRSEDFIKDIPNIIQKGKVSNAKRENEKHIETNDSRIVIKKKYKGDDRNWIITAFKIYKP